MARYWYVCKICGHEDEDVQCPISELDNFHMYCPDCHSEMERPPVAPRVRNSITWEIYSNREKGMLRDMKEAQKLRRDADRGGSKVSEEDKKGMKDTARILEGKRSNGKFKAD